MHNPLLPLLLPLLPLTLATTIPITVGSGALAFNPSTLSASIGDTLSFSYYPKNHSVTQSSFANPCHPLSGGIFSGFHPLSAGPGPVKFEVRVNDTAPLWIYCSQETHCQKGMAMVVNPPSAPSPNTLAAYQLAASKSGNSTSPPYIAGGIFVSRNATSATYPNSTASSTAPSSTAFSSGTASGSGNGSGSGTGSGSTSAGNSQTSPIVGFTGAAGRMVSGFGAVWGGVGLVVFALLCI